MALSDADRQGYSSCRRLRGDGWQDEAQSGHAVHDHLVGDVWQIGLAEDPTLTMYMSTSWYLWPTVTLVARLDPHQPVAGFQAMRSTIRAKVAAPRLNTVLLASFAGLALLLAVVGVVGYGVGQRTRELAVRLTLGAPRAGRETCDAR